MCFPVDVAVFSEICWVASLASAACVVGMRLIAVLVWNCRC